MQAERSVHRTHVCADTHSRMRLDLYASVGANGGHGIARSLATRALDTSGTQDEASTVVAQQPPDEPASIPAGEPEGTFSSGLDDRELLVVTKPLPRVLIMHTGGTLGMDPTASYEPGQKGVSLRRGTGGVYAGVVRSRFMLTCKVEVHGLLRWLR